MQPLPEEQDVLDASPVYIRVAAIVCIALAIISCSVSTYVYFKFPHPGPVRHVVRSGELVEPIEQYLFLFVAFQVVVALGVSIQALRWRHMLQRLADQERSAKAKNPRWHAASATVIYRLMSFFVCLGQVILLGATLWRAAMVIMNKI